MAPSATADGSSSGAGYTVPLFLNGQEHAAEKQFEIKSPVTGKTLYNCSNAGPALCLARRPAPRRRASSAVGNTGTEQPTKSR